jgi:hypothetical protein
MKLRMLALLCAVLALAGVGIGSAAGATTIPVRPYALVVISIGSTAPGDASSELCLVTPDNPNAYGGKINGAVAPGHTGELNIHLYKQDLATTVPTCVPTDINVSTNDPANLGIQCTKAGCHGGTLSLSSAASVQPGILATSATTVAVTLASGQSMKLPSGAVQVGSDSLTGPSTVTMILKPTVVATKALLTTACSDKQYLVDTNQNDGSKSNGPRAFEIGQPLSSDAANAGATLPSQGDAGVYVATIRTCAEDDNTVPGKPVTTKIAITGAGTASVAFVKAATINPQLWDGTRGKTCGAVKTASTEFGTDTLDASRILSCKGDYGDGIPLALDVRGWVPNTPGQLDPYGLLHPASPTTILSYNFT